MLTEDGTLWTSSLQSKLELHFMIIFKKATYPASYNQSDMEVYSHRWIYLETSEAQVSGSLISMRPHKALCLMHMT